MLGIELNKPIEYKHSSLRFFKENEYHTTRFCEDDVLLLVFDGILRFTENGTDIEIHPEEYYIQKGGGYQQGLYASDSPKYLYVHFHGCWDDTETSLPQRGKFNYFQFKPLIERQDDMCHKNFTLIEQSAVFYEILSKLKNNIKTTSLSNKIAVYLEENITSNLTLEDISKKFSYSKNHIINIFKKDYKTTPIEYINLLKVKHAERLLETTSQTAELVAEKSGFINYSHFYKTFYKINGISPTKWRNQKRIKPTEM